MVTSRITRQLPRLLLMLGAAGSLLLLFVALIGATATAQAAATIIRVPDDYSGVSFLPNQAALHGQGTGGGLYAEAGSGLRIDGAVFEKNWSIVFPYQFEGGQSGGGGIPPAPPVDIEGTPRPLGPHVDIGAYEWHGPQVFLPFVARTAPVRVGWAVGNDDGGVPAIVHTTDGGQTWTRQAVAAAIPRLDAGDISAVDEQTAWAAFVGNPGVTFPYVLHTTDGGATWFTQTLPAGVTGGVKSIKGVSRMEAWAATLDGVILHTTDGGATWTSIPHPGVVITQVNRMDVILPHIWIADADAKGAIIHSLDGGATWRREVITDAGATEGPLTVHAVSPDVAWASGTKSLSFFRTVNGGATWEKVITVGGFDHLDDICASSVADVWGAQNGDGVNGHIHWVNAPIGGAVEHVVATAPAVQGYTPGGVSCVDSRTAWVVAPKGFPPDPTKPRAVIVFTSDGETWTQATAPADIRYWKISMVGARR